VTEGLRMEMEGGNVFNGIDGGKEEGRETEFGEEENVRGGLRCATRLCIVRGSTSLGLRVC